MVSLLEFLPESNLVSSIHRSFVGDVLQVSVNCTILFLMELIFKYPYHRIRRIISSKASRSESTFLSVFEEKVGTLF